MKLRKPDPNLLVLIEYNTAANITLLFNYTEMQDFRIAQLRVHLTQNST